MSYDINCSLLPGLCELLLESRITLQKALFASNQLPKPDNYQNIWAECSEEGKSSMIQCREKVWDLLEKFIHLQVIFYEFFHFRNVENLK